MCLYMLVLIDTTVVLAETEVLCGAQGGAVTDVNYREQKRMTENQGLLLHFTPSITSPVTHTHTHTQPRRTVPQIQCL